MNLSRRTMLKSSAGALTASGLAGCLNDVAGDTTEFDSGYAAFFALWDWSQVVAGEEATIENPVEAGQMGHGWEPDGNLPRDVASTSAFVYLDTPEFSWAQDLAATLEADYDSVTAIDGLEGLESQMLASDHDHGHADEGGHADEHNETHAGEDEHHDDHAVEHNETHAGEVEHHDDHAGEHNETHAGEGEHHDDHEGEHNETRVDEGDRGQLDPHAWVDPILAQEIVNTIAAGFAEIDGENAETYEANAADYNERLADLDTQFQQLIEDADRSTAVLASHSSFQYLEARYGFELHTIAGISPDAEADSTEVANTVEIVNNNDIDVVLYDYFESDRLAETIVENSNATATAPLTPVAGTTTEWNDNGWDFIDQMEQITLPALRQALGAE
jgi:zinc transport system substrate-binding protein